MVINCVQDRTYSKPCMSLQSIILPRYLSLLRNRGRDDLHRLWTLNTSDPFDPATTYLIAKSLLRGALLSISNTYFWLNGPFWAARPLNILSIFLNLKTRKRGKFDVHFFVRTKKFNNWEVRKTSILDLIFTLFLRKMGCFEFFVFRVKGWLSRAPL